MIFPISGELIDDWSSLHSSRSEPTVFFVKSETSMPLRNSVSNCHQQVGCNITGFNQKIDGCKAQLQTNFRIWSPVKNFYSHSGFLCFLNSGPSHPLIKDRAVTRRLFLHLKIQDTALSAITICEILDDMGFLPSVMLLKWHDVDVGKRKHLMETANKSLISSALKFFVNLN